MEIHKREYIALLKREKAAESWLDSPNRTETEISKHLKHYEDILTKLNEMIIIYRVPDDRVLCGWEDK